MAARNGDKSITQADLAAAKDELKSDVKVVRDELKSDVKAVRDELKATRDELKSDISRLAVRMVKMDERMDNLEHSLRKEIQDNTSRILNAIDAFAKKGEAYDRKSFSHGDMLQSHEAKLREHDQRLAALEVNK